MLLVHLEVRMKNRSALVIWSLAVTIAAMAVYLGALQHKWTAPHAFPITLVVLAVIAVYVVGFIDYTPPEEGTKVRPILIAVFGSAMPLLFAWTLAHGVPPMSSGGFVLLLAIGTILFLPYPKVVRVATEAMSIQRTFLIWVFFSQSFFVALVTCWRGPPN